MEIALGRDASPELAVSLPLGARRITQLFLSADPVTKADLKRARRHVRAELGQIADRLRWEGMPACVIGTSKTFKQLARLAGAPPQRRGPFVTRTLRRSEVAAAVPRLARLPVHQRARLRGVSQARATQILAGAVIAKQTMSTLDIPCMEVSPWALREGILLHHLESVRSDSGLVTLSSSHALRPLDNSRGGLEIVHGSEPTA